MLAPLAFRPWPQLLTDWLPSPPSLPPQAVLSSLATEAPGLWRDELAYAERLLRDDVRNNSAWSQRRFVLAAAPPGALQPPAEAWNEEVDWACSRLRLAPHNEAAWAYLRGLCDGTLPGAPPRALAHEPRVLEACRRVLATHPSCPPALALLVDVLSEAAALLEESAAAADACGAEGPDAGIGQQGGSGSNIARWLEAAGRARADVAAALHKLVVADPLRQAYWQQQLACT